MSTSLRSARGPQPMGASALIMGMPMATWRLSRVLLHVLSGYVKSYVAWPGLDEQGWHDETIRWSRQLLAILGIALHVEGQARPGAKLVVSNHVSWLDIVAINSVVPSRFVSKADVAHWPLVGRLVTIAGSLYLVRERRRDAMRVLGLMTKAMQEGHTVAVFPEGTTGDGHGVMHFHANLLQAAINAQVPVQPLVLRYSDRQHAISPIAAYAGETTLMQSLWRIATARGLAIHARILPLTAVTHADRRALAASLEAQIGSVLAEQKM